MSLVFEASAMHSQEFYHRQPSSARSGLPRIFGMTASPIKTKSGVSEFSFWQKIKELEDLMDSKVYTCASESELAQSIPFSTPKFNFYRHKEIPSKLYEYLAGELQSLKEKHELLLKRFDLRKSGADCISKKISKIFSALIFCLDELGVWLSLKVAQSFSCSELGLCEESDAISWGKLDVLGEAIVKDFSSDASHAFATCVPSGPDWSIGDNVEDKMKSGLLTAKVVCLIESLLEYRDLKDIRCIVFVERIITAVVVDSLLNELLLKYSNWKSKYIAGNYSGLQSQTRKKQNEIVQEFREGMVNIIVATSILEEGLDVQSCNLVIRFDPSSTVCSFIQSRGRARRQHSDYILMVKSEDFATNSRLEKYLASEDIMRKASLRHASLPCSPLQSELNDEEFYCVESTGAIVTRTFSVGLIYFYCSRLPSDCYFKPAPRWDKNTCTLHLPKSCPLPNVVVQGNINDKVLKQTACLEACKQLHEIGALTDNLVPDVVVEEADSQESGMGSLTVNFKYVGKINLSIDLVLLCGRFQITLIRVLIDHALKDLEKRFGRDFLGDEIDYLLLPATGKHERPLIIDWQCVTSVLFSCEKLHENHLDCRLPKGYAHHVQTKDGPVCTCMLQNSLVSTLHNGHVYCITGNLGLNGNSLLTLRDCRTITYKKYMRNESSNSSVELPPELCSIVMSPISIATFYTFAFVPSIMHRLESLLVAGNLKILEAITTKKCQERFHLESLETLGDSFLKFAACQQLFKTYQNQHEGVLSVKKDKIISNAALCKLRCDRNLPGFIRNESFDPINWIVPGDRSGSYARSKELLFDTRKIYIRGIKVKRKTVADVVEALIGAFLSIGVEALTHGSYMLPEIRRYYQRLEFLGDSVLDYLMTTHFYSNYPGLSPEPLIDMRSASVNNNCYAQSSVKFGLHKHILHPSQDLHRHIVETIKNFEKLSAESTFGWESDTSFPKVLGHVIESLAGAILVDSGYNKESLPEYKATFGASDYA
ncbi:hypothetical protein CJ030_MR0G007159 [Morella rubra]|uniref:Uncharacterized protein n=1 Tax=Morella rubra TaxID=262757 RepID=A0A6A1UJN8_9ROSI|nr:hypothetical protein CJ030_MR0G007159 [Morella rubra]